MKFEQLGLQHMASMESFKRELIDNNEKFVALGSYKDDSFMDWFFKVQRLKNYDTLPEGFAPEVKYLTVDDNGVVCGVVSIRYDLMNHPVLNSWGGHIGYIVRPSKRKMGIGDLQLKEALRVCKDRFRLKEVLITCDKNNEASRRTIIKNGGVYEKDVDNGEEIIERYWVTIK